MNTIENGRMLPPTCQNILFSATYKDEVRMFAERAVPNANMISLKREELSVDAIKQLYLDCPNEDAKYEALCSVYGLCNIGQSIIFCHVRQRGKGGSWSIHGRTDGWTDGRDHSHFLTHIAKRHRGQDCGAHATGRPPVHGDPRWVGAGGT